MCHRRLTRPTRILEWLREAQKSTQKLAPKSWCNWQSRLAHRTPVVPTPWFPVAQLCHSATYARWMSIERMQFVERKDSVNPNAAERWHQSNPRYAWTPSRVVL
jgi:hypothetical protein